MQKKIIRIIFGVRPRTHTAPLFEELKMLSIFQINKYVIGKFMLNVYNSSTLEVFLCMFAYNSSIHSHETRQSAHFHIPLIKKELSKSSINYRGAVIWNDILKCNVNTNCSEYVFCKDFKYKILRGVL